MKLFIVFALFICSCDAQNSWSGPGRNRNVKALDTAYVILSTGQSNALRLANNFGTNFTIASKTNYRYDTTTNVFTRYYLPSGNVTTNLVDSIYTIRADQGSLAISNWFNSNGTMKVALDSVISKSFRKLRAQNKYVKVLSSIWLQGEQDCVIGTSSASYQLTLDSVIRRIRRIDAALTNVPFVIVKLREDSPEPTYQPGALTGVNTAFVNLSTSLTKVYLIRPEDIGAVHVDGVHYTNPASFLLIANAWNALIQNN